MTIEYKGLMASQSEKEGVKIFNKKGLLLYSYATPHMTFDEYDLACCINEYLDHCGSAMWAYYDFVKVMIPAKNLPEVDDNEQVGTTSTILCSRREQKKPRHMDPFKFVSTKW